jgi:hypothetical protein
MLRAGVPGAAGQLAREVDLAVALVEGIAHRRDRK